MCGILCKILSVPHNAIMDWNNVFEHWWTWMGFVCDPFPVIIMNQRIWPFPCRCVRAKLSRCVRSWNRVAGRCPCPSRAPAREELKKIMGASWLMPSYSSLLCRMIDLHTHATYEVMCMTDEENSIQFYTTRFTEPYRRTDISSTVLLVHYKLGGGCCGCGCGCWVKPQHYVVASCCAARRGVLGCWVTLAKRVVLVPSCVRFVGVTAKFDDTDGVVAWHACVMIYAL